MTKHDQHHQIPSVQEEDTGSWLKEPIMYLKDRRTGNLVLGTLERTHAVAYVSHRNEDGIPQYTGEMMPLEESSSVIENGQLVWVDINLEDVLDEDVVMVAQLGPQPSWKIRLKK